MSERPIFRDSARQSAFDRDGFVVVDFLDRRAIDRLLSSWSALGSDLQRFPFSNTIMSGDVDYRSRVHDAVRREIEDGIDDLLFDYRVCLCSYLAKPAVPSAQRGVVELHQDWTFVDESRFFSIGLWIPLVDVGEDNGCLRVVPGSHRLNREPRCLSSGFRYDSLLPLIEREFLQAIPMRAGRAFVYTQSLFHSSQPNRSDALRLVAGALAIPREASLLFVAPAGMDSVAIHEVDDAFYQRYQFGSVPDLDAPVALAPHRFEPLTEHTLRDRLRGVHV